VHHLACVCVAKNGKMANKTKSEHGQTLNKLCKKFMQILYNAQAFKTDYYYHLDFCTWRGGMVEIVCDVVGFLGCLSPWGLQSWLKLITRLARRKAAVNGIPNTDCNKATNSQKEWVKNFGVAWPTLNTSENIEKPRTLFGLVRLKYKRDFG